MISPMDDLDVLDQVMDSVNPDKLKFSSNTKFLDRQIDITITASDDATFSALAKAIELIKEAYSQEMQRLHSSP